MFKFSLTCQLFSDDVKKTGLLKNQLKISGQTSDVSNVSDVLKKAILLSIETADKNDSWHSGRFQSLKFFSDWWKRPELCQLNSAMLTLILSISDIFH